MSLYTSVCAHICVLMCSCVCAQVCVHVCSHVCARVRVPLHMCMCSGLCAHVHLCVAHRCVCMKHACMPVHVFLCVYVWCGHTHIRVHVCSESSGAGPPPEARPMAPASPYPLGEEAPGRCPGPCHTSHTDTRRGHRSQNASVSRL